MSDVIYETPHFTLERSPHPFVCRTEGGHMRIFPKDHTISERRDLTPKQAIECMRLSMVSGEALQSAMNDVGIPVVRINYEDLGNWAFKRKERPVFHSQIFGRSQTAVKQLFPEAVYLPDRSSGFYDDFLPLTDDDVTRILYHINIILKREKYQDNAWGL